jgi:hypothetical protein
VKWKIAQLVKPSAVPPYAEQPVLHPNPTVLLCAKRPSVPGNAKLPLSAPTPKGISLANNPVAPKKKNLVPLEATAHAAHVTRVTPPLPFSTPKFMPERMVSLVPKLPSSKSSTAFLTKPNKVKLLAALALLPSKLFVSKTLFRPPKSRSVL